MPAEPPTSPEPTVNFAAPPSATEHSPSPATPPVSHQAPTAARKKPWAWLLAIPLLLGTAALAFTLGRSTSPADQSTNAAAAVEAVEADQPGTAESTEPSDTSETSTPSPGIVIETAAVVVSGSPLGPIGVPDTAAGLPAPAASGVGPNGQRVSIGSDGIGRVIGFFAHWCPHCQEELPEVTTFLEEAPLPQGVEVLAVSTAVDANAANYPPSAWLSDWTGPAIMDDATMTLASAYGVTALPAWVAVDANGNVLYRTTGRLNMEHLGELASAVAPGSTTTPDFIAQANTRIDTAEVAVEGEWLQPYAVPDEMLGLPAPNASGVSYDGTEVSFGGDGVGRLIGFFANWCPHCQSELPAVVAWQAATDQPDGVEVMAVSTGFSADATPPADWFRGEGWEDRVLIDDANGTVGAAFGLTAFPYWVAVDAEGNVVYRGAGRLSEAQLTELAEAVKPGSTSTPSFIPTGLHRVTPVEANELLQDRDDIVLLDVRTPEEFAAGHIDGAVNIDFYSPDFYEQLSAMDPSQPYMIYCDSGNRSGQTFQALAAAAWPELYDVEGGIQAWNAEALPLAGE